ncbi:MAG: amidohydrolase family protein [Phycisphaeraceae bacterium]|nr:amidohydrolase family protein [Phycisphaeraceae bacterium]
MTTSVLDNALLWTGDGSSFAGHVVIDGEEIASVGRGRYTGPAAKIDLNGSAVSPGLIDLMVLGGFDKSILRDDPLDIARAYLRLGVTSCQFCSGTLPWSGMVRITENITRAMTYAGHDAATTLGYYLEGPFQDPDLTGASLRENALPPTPDHVRRVIEELGGPLTMINVSPGVEGDAAAVKMLRQAGKTVSMAHSEASADRVLACIEAGTTVCGHSFNNNYGGGQIEPGVQRPTIEHVAMTDDRVRFMHLICDGSHVHPVYVRLLLRAKGVSGICLVTDCVPRAGMPDGPYTWDDGRPFYKKGGVGRTDKHHLTGSALLLPDHFRNFVKFTGLPPAEAIRTVTLNPAASIGVENRIGQIAVGRDADLVMWDANLTIKRVWRRGREVTDVSAYAEIVL